VRLDRDPQGLRAADDRLQGLGLGEEGSWRGREERLFVERDEDRGRRSGVDVRQARGDDRFRLDDRHRREAGSERHRLRLDRIEASRRDSSNIEPLRIRIGVGVIEVRAWLMAGSGSDWISLSEAAAILEAANVRFRPSTIGGWARTGKLQSIKLGGRRFVRRGEVRALITPPRRVRAADLQPGLFEEIRD
jgi:hypothetical protein